MAVVQNIPIGPRHRLAAHLNALLDARRQASERWARVVQARSDLRRVLRLLASLHVLSESANNQTYHLPFANVS